MVQPVGLAAQFTLTETGERILKDRLTHDMSYCISSKRASINKRTLIDQYPEMIYGFCLTRIIHYICALRWKFPNKKILISKYDFSDAYKQISLSAKSIAQTILVNKDKAYLATECLLVEPLILPLGALFQNSVLI